MGLFLGFLCCSIGLCFFFMPIPYCLDDCSFVVYSEVSQVDSSNAILLSQDCFGYLGSFVLPELTHWKRLWCWEGLGAGGEGDDRGWEGWMASLTRWMWVSVHSGSWWWTEKPGVLRFMGSQRVGHDWVTELNWTVLPYELWNSLF